MCDDSDASDRLDDSDLGDDSDLSDDSDFQEAILEPADDDSDEVPVLPEADDSDEAGALRRRGPRRRRRRAPPDDSDSWDELAAPTSSSFTPVVVVVLAFGAIVVLGSGLVGFAIYRATKRAVGPAPPAPPTPSWGGGGAGASGGGGGPAPAEPEVAEALEVAVDVPGDAVGPATAALDATLGFRGLPAAPAPSRPAPAGDPLGGPPSSDWTPAGIELVTDDWSPVLAADPTYLAQVPEDDPQIVEIARAGGERLRSEPLTMRIGQLLAAGDRLFCVHPGHAALTVLDPRDATRVAQLDVPPGEVSGAAVHPGNPRLLVLYAGEQFVGVDAEELRVLGAVPYEGSNLYPQGTRFAIGARGRYVYPWRTSVSPRGVIVLDPARGFAEVFYDHDTWTIQPAPVGAGLVVTSTGVYRAGLHERVGPAGKLLGATKGGQLVLLRGDAFRDEEPTLCVLDADTGAELARAPVGLAVDTHRTVAFVAPGTDRLLATPRSATGFRYRDLDVADLARRGRAERALEDEGGGDALDLVRADRFGLLPSGRALHWLEDRDLVLLDPATRERRRVACAAPPVDVTDTADALFVALPDAVAQLEPRGLTLVRTYRFPGGGRVRAIAAVPDERALGVLLDRDQKLWLARVPRRGGEATAIPLPRLARDRFGWPAHGFPYGLAWLDAERIVAWRRLAERNDYSEIPAAVFELAGETAGIEAELPIYLHGVAGGWGRAAGGGLVDLSAPGAVGSGDGGSRQGEAVVAVAPDASAYAVVERSGDGQRIAATVYRLPDEVEVASVERALPGDGYSNRLGDAWLAPEAGLLLVRSSIGYDGASRIDLLRYEGDQ